MPLERVLKGRFSTMSDVTAIKISFRIAGERPPHPARGATEWSP